MIPLPAAFSGFALALHGLLCLRLSSLFLMDTGRETEQTPEEAAERRLGYLAR